MDLGLKSNDGSFGNVAPSRAVVEMVNRRCHRVWNGEPATVGGSLLTLRVPLV
jgi:hypothetical protein